MARHGLFSPRLPAELDLCIIDSIRDNEDHFTTVKTLHSLVLTSRRCYRICLPMLYQAHGKCLGEEPPKAMQWAIIHNIPATFSHALEFAPSLGTMDGLSLAIHHQRQDFIDRLLGREEVCDEIRGPKGIGNKSPVFAIVQSGSLDLLRRVWAMLPSVQMRRLRNMKQQTALHVACLKGRLEFVRFFLNRGANPDYVASGNVLWPWSAIRDPVSALGLAISPADRRMYPHRFRIGTQRRTGLGTGHYDVVEEIMRRRPRLSHPGRYIKLAVTSGDEKMLKLLRRYGLELPSAPDQRELLLHEAIYSGMASLVQELVDLGAGHRTVPLPYQPDVWRLTALQAVTISGQFNSRSNSAAMAETLLRGGVPEGPEPSHESSFFIFRRWSGQLRPLRLALEIDDIPLVRCLLDAGAHSHPEQVCPLYFARSIEALRLLEEYGLDMNRRGGDGSLPIIEIALNAPSVELFDYALSRVTDVNATDEQGRTILSHFCQAMIRNQRSPHLASLLSRRPNVDGRDELGATALHYAARWGTVNMVQHLVERGADANAADKEGFTPLHRALDPGEPELQFFYDDDDKKHMMHGFGMIKKVDILLFQGRADPDARSHDGTYAMHIPSSGRCSIRDVEDLLYMYSEAKSPVDPDHPHQPYRCRDDDEPGCVYAADDYYAEANPPPRSRPRDLTSYDYAAEFFNRPDRHGKFRVISELSGSWGTLHAPSSRVRYVTRPDGEPASTGRPTQGASSIRS